MVYTLTFNPSLDYVMEMNGLRPGAMNRATRTEIYPGGKGINVSVVLNTLGTESIMLGFVAGFTGDEIESSLKKAGCRTDFIHLKSGLSRINVKLCSPESTELNAPGPFIGKDDLLCLYNQLNALNEGDVLVLAGAIPAGLPHFTYQYILDYLKEKNITTVVDATGEALLSTLNYRPFLIKPNRQELEELFSTKLLLRADVEKYARKLQDMGARNVLISLDHEGAVLLTEDKELISHDAPSGRVVNPVGAGDSMLAGFISGWLETGSYENALKTGLASGSASAFSVGLPTKEDILALRRFL